MKQANLRVHDGFGSRADVGDIAVPFSEKALADCHAVRPLGIDLVGARRRDRVLIGHRIIGLFFTPPGAFDSGPRAGEPVPLRRLRILQLERGYQGRLWPDEIMAKATRTKHLIWFHHVALGLASRLSDAWPEGLEYEWAPI